MLTVCDAAYDVLTDPKKAKTLWDAAGTASSEPTGHERRAHVSPSRVTAEAYYSHVLLLAIALLLACYWCASVLYQAHPLRTVLDAAVYRVLQMTTRLVQASQLRLGQYSSVGAACKCAAGSYCRG